MRTKPRVAVFVTILLLALAPGGCGGGGESGSDMGGGPSDVNVLVPFLDGGAGRDGAVQDAGRPDAGDVRRDGSVDAPRDAAVPGDAATDGPRDAVTPPPPDVPPADVDPCRACPDDHPVCVGGRCACLENSCGAGEFCNDGVCAPCAVDARCGPTCGDCRPGGGVCAPDGSGCVECDPRESVPCAPGERCAGGACVACDSAEGCGEDCAPCPAGSPVCEGGVCVCAPGSCLPGRRCGEDGQCRLCDTALACGDECVDCRLVGTPNCVDGECRCLSDDHCASGRWCADGACVDCAVDDALHCGASCAVCEGATPVCVDGRCACSSDADCGGAARCDAGGCVACDDGAHCGDECLPCPAEQPLCADGACVVCVADEGCGPTEWCDLGTCRRCRDDDAAHCGAACTACEGGTPACTGGRCVCAPGSCPAYEACVDAACVPCDVPERCGADCGACGAPTPFCAPGGAGCVACLGDGDCVAPEVCRDDFVCGPLCEASGCASNLAPDAKKCDRAQTIGRLDATQTAFLSGDTTGDGDDDNLTTNRTACWDAKYDNFYRIYLKAGDAIHVVLDPTTASFDSMLKLYRGTDCQANGTDDLVDCYNPGSDGQDDTFDWTAGADGWVTLVVDGRSAFSDEGDWGSYVLRVTLACADDGCCCP